ncbi:hypothetical protein F4818DRAFT_443520 [Hypoxylon cercidicola]|nr:hypothetical protein F4818DRAFT_443520 [Hypoxylon cercidicola]
MESFDQFLSKEEYDDMIHARTVIPVLRKYEVDIRRLVRYPDLVPYRRSPRGWHRFEQFTQEAQQAKDLKAKWDSSCAKEKAAKAQRIE